LTVCNAETGLDKPPKRALSSSSRHFRVSRRGIRGSLREDTKGGELRKERGNTSVQKETGVSKNRRKRSTGEGSEGTGEKRPNTHHAPEESFWPRLKQVVPTKATLRNMLRVRYRGGKHTKRGKKKRAPEWKLVTG